MANTPSAKKAVRKIAARTEINKSRRSRVRTFVRKLEDALLSGDKQAAGRLTTGVQPNAGRPFSKEP